MVDRGRSTSEPALPYAPRAAMGRDPSGPPVRLYDPIPLRALPPNLITATAMGCGLASVWSSLATRDPGLGAWLVLVAVLLDKLDGTVARAVRGSSEFGVQFDSFSDFVSFGVAPAALVFVAAGQLAPQTWGDGASVAGLPARGVLGALCLVYAVMTSVRLARFNVTTATLGPALFLGLPSTASGALIATAYLAAVEAGLDRSHATLFGALPACLAINAALMLSNLPLPKVKVSSHPALRAFQVGSAAAVYVLVPLRTGYWFILALLIGYLVTGFAWVGPRLWRARQAAPT